MKQIDLIAQTAGHGMSFIENAKAAFTLRSAICNGPPVLCHTISFIQIQESKVEDIDHEKKVSQMLLYPKITGALCASGYSKLGLQEACNGMYTVSSSWEGTQVSPTLTANNAGGNQRMPDKGNFTSIIQQNEKRYVVRRLTPKECCRLQGFPDWWEDGAEGSDTNRYKMWGNGVALPCVFDLLRRLAEEGEEA